MKIYFMGICGTAMGNAALLARAAGHDCLLAKFHSSIADRVL
jgi:hypothetical protein